MRKSVSAFEPCPWKCPNASCNASVHISTTQKGDGSRFSTHWRKPIIQSVLIWTVHRMLSMTPELTFTIPGLPPSPPLSRVTLLVDSLPPIMLYVTTTDHWTSRERGRHFEISPGVTTVPRCQRIHRCHGDTVPAVRSTHARRPNKSCSRTRGNEPNK